MRALSNGIKMESWQIFVTLIEEVPSMNKQQLMNMLFKLHVAKAEAERYVSRLDAFIKELEASDKNEVYCGQTYEAMNRACCRLSNSLIDLRRR